jgi:hypothetical protein
MPGDHQVWRPTGILRRVNKNHGPDGDDEQPGNDCERHDRPKNFQLARSENLPGLGWGRTSRPISHASVDYAGEDYDENDRGNHQNKGKNRRDRLCLGGMRTKGRQHRLEESLGMPQSTRRT